MLLKYFFRHAYSECFKFVHLESSKQSLKNHFLNKIFHSLVVHINFANPITIITPENKRLYLWYSNVVRRCRNKILAWNGFSRVMIEMLFLFLALWAARDECDIKYCFQRIGLSIIRRQSNVVWQWFSSVSTWIHHCGKQHVFIDGLTYIFTVTQIWTVDGFCRLFFWVKAHRLICRSKVKKINVMHRVAGKFKVIFPLLNKRISL